MSATRDEAAIKAELLRLDDQRCEFQNTGDVDACAALCTEDMIHIHAVGIVEDKATWLAKNVAVEKRPVRTRGPREIRLYGDYAIMIGPQYLETAERRGELMVTQVWRLDGDQWRQSTFHACRAAAT